jgi:hypothetical protein
MSVQEQGSSKRYIYLGAAAGFAFAVLFIRIPHWGYYLGEDLAALVYGTLIALFTYGGARAGVALYEKRLKAIQDAEQRDAALSR